VLYLSRQKIGFHPKSVSPSHLTASESTLNSTTSRETSRLIELVLHPPCLKICPQLEATSQYNIRLELGSKLRLTTRNEADTVQRTAQPSRSRFPTWVYVGGSRWYYDVWLLESWERNSRTEVSLQAGQDGTQRSPHSHALFGPFLTC
jgi:hypothetical protein